MVHPLHRKQKEEDRNMTDLFGHSSLKEQYGANPFSVFDTNNRDWKLHRQLWLNKGILPPLMPIKQRSMVNFDDDRDLSTLSWKDFLQKYRSIIKKSCRLIKHGAFAVIVVGEVRNRSGYYAGFVPETIKAFLDAGMVYWNEAVLLTPYVNASKRVSSSMKNKKLVKVHQNVLIFKRKK